MKKIPVGATIAHAYRFAFGEFFNILKLLWLPFLGTCACAIFLGSQMAALSQAFATHDFSAVTMPWPLFALIYALSFTAALITITAIFQYALGQIEARDRWYYFPLGMPMWRVAGATLAMVLALMGLAIVFFLAAMLVLFLFRIGLGLAHVSDVMIKGIMAFDAALAFLIGYCGFILCAVRFGFLLWPTTLAEGRIGLFRSWALSHGNFWRMFLVSLAIFLPFLFLEFLAMYFGGLMPSLPPPGATVQQIQAMQAEQNLRMMAVLGQMQHYWYIAYPLFAVVAALLYGLLAGAQSFAYRALAAPGATANPP